MTTLLITPKVENKTARFKGTIAAGEHVAVTIKDGADWSAEGLTLRVIDLTTHRTLAVFPRPEETLEEGETPDAWDTHAGDLICTLNLNTTRMVAAARHMIRVPVMFVLGNSSEDERTLYFRDCYEVVLWPERIGDDTPYDLDKWPRQIDEWTEQMESMSNTLTEHVADATLHVTEEKRAAWDAKYAKPGTGIPFDDLSEDVQERIEEGGGIKQSQADWNQTDTTAPDFIKNKPTIPAPVDISGKADKSEMNAALALKLDISSVFPEWLASPPDPYQGGAIVSHAGRIWRLGADYAGTDSEPGVTEEWGDVLLKFILDLKQDLLSPAQLAAANSGATAAKVASWDGYAAQIATKADADTLPYALVVPGEWQFSGDDVVPGVQYSIEEQYTGEEYRYLLKANGELITIYESVDVEPINTVNFSFVAYCDPAVDIVAARVGAGIIQLADRAENAVAVSTNMTLTLPAANPGHSRDLYVRLTVSATSAVTWTVAQGESWDAMGAPPSSFAAGTYLYRFTEVAPGVWHCEDMLALVGLEAALAAINGGVAP